MPGALEGGVGLAHRVQPAGVPDDARVLVRGRAARRRARVRVPPQDDDVVRGAMSRSNAIEALKAEDRSAIAIDLGAELLKRGRGLDLVVGGESMWPLVRHGDRVRLEPA